MSPLMWMLMMPISFFILFLFFMKMYFMSLSIKSFLVFKDWEKVSCLWKW